MYGIKRTNNVPSILIAISRHNMIANVIFVLKIIERGKSPPNDAAGSLFRGNRHTGVVASIRFSVALRLVELELETLRAYNSLTLISCIIRFLDFRLTNEFWTYWLTRF